MLNRRHFIGAVGAAGLVAATPASARASSSHEHFMAAAIEEGRKNERYPFGAVIVRGDVVVARGVNAHSVNPAYHGEMAAIDDYAQRLGSQGWEGLSLYTTAEPCPMCMSACAWSFIDKVVWGTSIEGLRRTGLYQIDMSAMAVAEAASEFYSPKLLLGGVLVEETDELFRCAQAIRDGEE
ncbi:nucleoside deaminase [Kitasatospora sp. NPDC101183]|uniref:nucleoside deaminase n=1 Tax=Kitasatospora sp. NPDC101183 TaxID=3364100 RepID=UPI0038174022